MAGLRPGQMLASYSLLGSLNVAEIQQGAADQTDDWGAFLKTLEQQQASALAAGPVARDYLERFVWPNLALGYAKTTRLAAAQVLVAKTPLDCDACVDARGKIAAMAGDRAGSDRWFALVDGRSPEIPYFAADWGAALLAERDVDGAIAKLEEAHRKGPRFADPLELWGEALMRKGDYAAAAAKFEQADKYAPRWGRDHLRWGQALAKLGRADAAKAQFAAAAGMDLSAADRAELARVQARG